MIASKETQDHLEFSKVLQLIADHCVAENGKVRVLNLQPLADENAIKTTLQQVEEARGILESEGGMPLYAFEDMRPLLNKIEPLNSFLEVEDCQKVLSFLDLCRELQRFILKQAERFPLLADLAANLDPLVNLSNLMHSTIEPSGEIYDNASQELKAIRKEIAFISKQVHVKLERIMRKQSEHLQEDYITLREGRLVLPVREFSVNKIPGIVHGQSGTGKTQFVEPMEVVQMNNQLHQLYIHEQNEIIRILRNLADRIREKTTEILANFELSVHLDTLQARARYSRETNAATPEINAEFRWEIKNGYHPLLLNKLGRNAVPLSLKMDREQHILIISGPNAGGKTVALKTVGLLQLMFQCGIHIPVSRGSRFPVCERIFAVIGDEQSIENDLSTFSSHLTQLKTVLGQVSDRSLVLIDEIGAGTDPAEGAALAVAILEELKKSRAKTLVSTHHSELKSFAHREAGVTNAAMQFDPQKLEPKFVLESGVPGSSYAFEISRRMGLSETLLRRAEEISGSSHSELESLIVELAKIKQEYERRTGELSIKETEVEGLRALYSTRNEALEKNRKKLEREAKEEAGKILATVNRTIENTIREIRESQGDPLVIKKGRQRIAELKKMAATGGAENQKPSTLSIEDLETGQPAGSARFGITGEIGQIFRERGEVELISKGMKLILPFSDLELKQGKKSKKTQPVQISTSITETKNEIDLRGMQREEAIMELERYLDDALHSGWKELRIIHGKGTGSLRKGIHDYLKKSKRFKSYRLGNYGEGDTGVTIIEI